MKKYELVYKTSITPFFPICFIGKNYSADLSRLVSKNLPQSDLILAVIYQGVVNWFFPRSLAPIGRELLDEFFRSKPLLKKIQIKEKAISQNLFKGIKTPVESLFKERVLNDEGEAKLRRIFQAYSDYGYFIDVPGFLFQLYYSEKFKKELFNGLANYSLEQKEEIFNLTLSSNRKTNYEKFLFTLYNLLLNKDSKVTNQELANVKRKFYWVIHDYLGEIIDEKYLKKEIAKLKKKPEGEIRDELKEVNERKENIKKVKKKLSKNLLKKIEKIHQILYFYNERKKEVLNKVNIYLRNIIEFKFPRIKLSEIHKIYQLTPQEIVELLKGKEIKNLKERESKWVYEIKNGFIRNGDKKYFSLLFPKGGLKLLKGIPASPGKVKGKVNVILNISHIFKFRENEILVAPFTNINYLPVMRKAKAILTETGGLTSHAAIASREFKKPCIVGIKNLIAALKDEDLVEVDADKGMIKIIKS